MKKAMTVFLMTFCLWGSATAGDNARTAKIKQIIEAQGLLQMFQEQLDQSKAAAGEMGKRIYQQVQLESGAPAGQENPKMEQAYRRYMERSSAIFSAKELVDIWTAHYGKNLSDADLDQILAYYLSPVGKRDVLASKAATAGFTQVFMNESQSRGQALLKQFMAELKAAMAQ